MAYINADTWTLFDKIMYGGLGYGPFCLPTDFFKVIIAIIFPPLGEIMNIIEDGVSDTFPYITWDAIKLLCDYENISKIIYSFVLTTLFYIPGLVYTLTNIVNKEQNLNYKKKSSAIYKLSNSSNLEDELSADEIKQGINAIGTGVNYVGDGANIVGGGISSGVDAIGSLF